MMARLRHEDCTEPEGQEVTEYGPTGHVLLMREMGYCPWCGRAADAQAFEDTRRDS